MDFVLEFRSLLLFKQSSFIKTTTAYISKNKSVVAE